MRDTSHVAATDERSDYPYGSEVRSAAHGSRLAGRDDVMLLSQNSSSKRRETPNLNRHPHRDICER